MHRSEIAPRGFGQRVVFSKQPVHVLENGYGVAEGGTRVWCVNGYVNDVGCQRVYQRGVSRNGMIIFPTHLLRVSKQATNKGSDNWYFS